VFVLVMISLTLEYYGVDHGMLHTVEYDPFIKSQLASRN
jgi:hypothetical protein